jgi:hypothetical protein
MNALIAGTIVSYQGRCWLVIRVAGAWLHVVTPSGHGHYHGLDLPRTAVSTSLTSTESPRAEMYCPFRK